MSDYLSRTKNGTSFAGSDVTLFGLLALASGLRLYANSGIRPNKAYTPTNMLKTAAHYTGKSYKRGDYLKAADDCTALANKMKAEPRTDD